MSTLEVLQKARSLIADPAHWSQGWGNMGQRGGGRTCAVGAVRVAAGLSTMIELDRFDGNRNVISAEKALRNVIGGRDPISYNDSHSHECVIAMFDAAIEQEQAK